MQDPEKFDAPPATTIDSPSDPFVVSPSGFDPLTDLHLAPWVINPVGVRRIAGNVSSAAQSDSRYVERPPCTEDGTRLFRRGDLDRASTGRPPLGDPACSDGLTLDRLYARFDAMARGWVNGDSSRAHQSIVERLAANQARAVELGWTNFLVTRRGGSGRLELQGSRAPGHDRELVPDQIPYR